MTINVKLLAVVGAVNLLTFAAGNSYAWSSPISEVLKSLDPNVNPLKHPLLPNEISWIVSIISLSAMLSVILTSFIQTWIGRKYTLLLSSIPVIISSIICFFATNSSHFFIARLILGFGIGSVFSVIPIYIGEISEIHNRGIMGCCTTVALNLGHLFIYIVGPFVHLKTLSCIMLISPILFVVLFSLAPESPYYFAAKGKFKEAETSLKRLRKDRNVLKELEEIKIMVNQSRNNLSFIEAVKSKSFTRGIVITVLLMYFQQFVGITALSSFMQSIFSATGVSFPAEFSVIMVSTIQNCTVIISTFLVDKLGRKILLLASSIGMSIALFTMGLFFFLKYLNFTLTDYYWLPIAVQMSFVSAYNIGLGPVPFVLTGELFSPCTKPLGSTLTATTNLFLAFVTTLLFPSLVEVFNMHGAFWFFAINGVLCGLFTLRIPETKGRSFQEILNILER